MVTYMRLCGYYKVPKLSTRFMFEILDSSLHRTHLTSLGLSFLICDMGLVINFTLPTLGVVVEST